MSTSVSISKICDPLDPVTPEFIQNPYPIYKVLREEAPLYWNEHRKWWLLSRYEDVLLSYRDDIFARQAEPRLHKLYNSLPPKLHCPFAQIFDRFQEPKGSWLTGKFPPIHSRMKRIFQPSFSSEQINKLRPFVEELCNDLIDKAKEKGSFDIIADYAYPIPFIVVAKLLGLPSEDLPKIRQWCKEILALWDVGASPSSRANKCVDEYTNYVLPLVVQRRKEFRDDFLSSMTLPDRDGFRLTDQQIASNAVLFTFAGFATTEGLIGNGMFALLKNRDQLELLQEDPSLIDDTVEECLRYDTPAQLHLKVMLEDIEVRGKVLRKNDKVLTFTGAANRDPEMFAEPDKFLIKRTDNKHLAFGSGIHYCIGAPLSRMEAQVAIGILVKRLPEIRLATDQISYRKVYRPRAIESLPVLF